MKILKWVAFVLLGLAVFVILLSFVAPTEYKVERSITVNQSVESVFPLVGTWKGFTQWSPWNELDPNMVVTIEGEDGTVGSSYKWKGNDSVGTGEMVFTEVVPGTLVQYDLHFLEPFESNAKNKMQVKPADNGVQVIWSMESSMPRPMNLMMLFMDMEAMIGKDFDKGLEKLKSYAESPQASFKAVEHNMPACKLLYIRRNIKVEEVNDATKAAYEELYRFTGMASIKVTGAPLAIYEQWDGKQAEILWSLPVESLPETISGKILKMEKPETFTLLAVYKGGYAGMENFYEVFDAYIQSKGYTITGGPIEEYVTDPEIEKDTSAWITNVYFPVSKAPSL